MTAPAAPSVQGLALGDLDHEIANTRRMLERVPDAHWDWRPHPKSATLGELASHVASLLVIQVRTLGADTLDFTSPAAAELRSPPAANRAELLALFDRTVARVRASLAEVSDDATWLKPWSLRRGEQVLFEMPKVAVFRALGISHLVHHRAQLGLYLRLLDVAVPGMYGPTADE